MKQNILFERLQERKIAPKEIPIENLSLFQTGLFLMPSQGEMEKILFHHQITTVSSFFNCSFHDYQTMFSDSFVKVILGLKNLLSLKYFEAEFPYSILFSSPIQLTYAVDSKRRYYAVDIFDEDYDSCSLERLGFTEEEITFYFLKYFLSNPNLSFHEILELERRKTPKGRRDKIFREKINLYFSLYQKSLLEGQKLQRQKTQI